MSILRYGFALLLLACCIRAGAAPGVDAREIVAYNSYLQPPFVQADGAPGLAQGLVDALNRELKGWPRVTLENLPRQRLMKRQLADAQSFDGISLFLVPAFVDDAQQTRWLWTRPLFEDSNVLIFPAGRGEPLPRTVEDLQGLRFGGVLGHRYVKLDEMVQAGALVREDSANELVLLRNIALGRIDFTQMNRVSYMGLLAAWPELAPRLQAVSAPRQLAFGRRILLGRGQPELAARIDEALARLPCDKLWRAQAQQVGVELAACQR